MPDRDQGGARAEDGCRPHLVNAAGRRRPWSRISSPRSRRRKRRPSDPAPDAADAVDGHTRRVGAVSRGADGSGRVAPCDGAVPRRARVELLHLAARRLVGDPRDRRGPGVRRRARRRHRDVERAQPDVPRGARGTSTAIGACRRGKNPRGVLPGARRAGHSRYEFEGARRGWLVAGTLYARVWDRTGLRALEVQRRDPKHIRVYPRPVALRHLPAPLNTQTSAGN